MLNRVRPGGPFLKSSVAGSSSSTLSSQYTFGTHAEAIYNAEAQKSFVVKSARATTTGLPRAAPFSFVGQQFYVDVQPQATRPLVSGATPRIGSYLYIQGQTEYTQQPQVWLALQAPAAAVTGILGSYYAVPQQFYDATAIGLVWRSVVAGSVPTIGSFVNVAAQIDLTPPSVFQEAGVRGQTPPVISSWFSAPLQTDYTPLQPVVHQAYGSVLILGPTVHPNAPVPAQFDISANASVVWTFVPLSVAGALPPPVTSFHNVKFLSPVGNIMSKDITRI